MFLENLPYDIIYELYCYVGRSGMQTLSLVSKKTRQIAIPLLFQKVLFKLRPDFPHRPPFQVRCEIHENRLICHAIRRIRTVVYVEGGLDLPQYFWKTVSACPNLESLDLEDVYNGPSSLKTFLSTHNDAKLNSLRCLWIPDPDWIGIVLCCPDLVELKVKRLRNKDQYHDCSSLFQALAQLPNLRIFYWWAPLSATAVGDISSYSPHLEELGIVGPFTQDTFSDAIPCLKAFKNLTYLAIPHPVDWNMEDWLPDSSDDDAYPFWLHASIQRLIWQVLSLIENELLVPDGPPLRELRITTNAGYEQYLPGNDGHLVKVLRPLSPA